MRNLLAMGLLCIATSLQGTDQPSCVPTDEPCDVPTLHPDELHSALRAEDLTAGCRNDGIEELFVSLLDWIGNHTDYNLAGARNQPPHVTFVEAGDQIVCEGKDVVVDDNLKAIYDGSTRRIQIVLPWSINNTFDQSILLHELVHDLQLASRHWYCPEETEWEAYKLQDMWLAEQGVDSGFDWMYVYFLSRCPRDMHP